MMTSKEIVLRAIERRDPPRLPICYFNRNFDCSDTLAIGYQPADDFTPAGEHATEWGYVWERLDGTMGQPSHLPLEDWSRIDGYPSPDPFAPGRFAGMREWAAANADSFLKFSLGITGFNQATFLRGFAPFLMDLYTDPDRAGRVLDLVFDFENGMIAQAIALPVDAIVFGDDWGTQQGLIIDPALWRQVFRPRYAEQFARIRQAGKKVWFHTCGNVYPITGDLIDIGVDVLELLQPDLLGIDQLARDFGGHVCFCCAIDHQRLAISGTRDEIHTYARHLTRALGAHHGGFIAYIEDYACLGMSERNYQWIREAFHGINGETPHGIPLRQR